MVTHTHSHFDDSVFSLPQGYFSYGIAKDSNDQPSNCSTFSGATCNNTIIRVKLKSPLSLYKVFDKN